MTNHLNKLDNINWCALETLMGDAQHVPKALLGLLSHNESDFDKAYWKLENHVVVQGDLYSAAEVLPDILGEALIKAKFKPGILELMFQIGDGYSNNKSLMDNCHFGIVKTLKELLAHPEIKGTSTENLIKTELNDLVEYKLERDLENKVK